MLAGAAVVGVAVGWMQALGVVLVGGGILLVRGLSGETDARGLILALAIGAAIAGYTLIDKEGVEHASVISVLQRLRTRRAGRTRLARRHASGAACPR